MVEIVTLWICKLKEINLFMVSEAFLRGCKHVKHYSKYIAFWPTLSLVTI